MRTSEGLDNRRRRILYRAWHRGTREMDLILGPFCDACLSELAGSELDDLETLMETRDTTLFAWIIGTEPVPDEHNHTLFQRLVAFHRDQPIE
ncbi:MAG: succinate dehydrogenase assembly factor 2 [Pseudomonadota bacterium]